MISVYKTRHIADALLPVVTAYNIRVSSIESVLRGSVVSVTHAERSTRLGAYFLIPLLLRRREIMRIVVNVKSAAMIRAEEQVMIHFRRSQYYGDRSTNEHKLTG